MPFQNEFMTSHSAYWAGPPVLTGETAEWAGSLFLTGHNSDLAGKQVPVKMQWYMTPSYFFRCSRLVGPNYRKKEEICFSDSLVLGNSARNGEGKILSNTTCSFPKQAPEI